ncbi:ATP-grasp domain-containing protein [Nonomuraea sp. NPDC050536]|uniref:ATP-grasp domain-containing protein n=1 Tax=Nonomuraea sp. NPDC050536 TaxID=3364366 RepID=UPI0037C7E3FF
MHAVLEGTHVPVARSKYLASCVTWDETGDDQETFVRTLLTAAKRIGRPAVLLALDDISAINIACNAHLLSPAFLLPEQAGELPSRLADKRALAVTCAELGVSHPDTVVAVSRADVKSAVEDYGFPMVAKWARPWTAPKDARMRSTAVVHSAEHVAGLYEQAARMGRELLLQRYIPPVPHADWFFHGYFMDDSTCAFAGTGRKDRAYPPTAGLTTLGRWLPNARIAETAQAMAASLRYAGIVDMDFRYCRRSDRFYLLDFNPRIGAQFGLFRDPNDLDVVRSAYLNLTGQPHAPCLPVYGRTYLVENYDLLRKLRKRPGGARPAPGWLYSLGHASELAWYSKDDLKPFLGMVEHTLLRSVRIHRR